MSFLIYFLILIFKIIEEALRTLRIIVVTNGKKIFGAILQFFIALFWIIVTGTVIMDIKNDPFRVFIYCLGSLLGSYIGSLIEEKMAMGTNVFMVEVSSNVAYDIINKLKYDKYKISVLDSYRNNYEVLMVTSPRKKTSEVINIIRQFDKNANIILEKVKIVSADVK